ncbi:DUF2993 domain-containing protein [Georgenia faecalis]|uniref:LmeA family phospholipid-binding protein n=1 Tax=Georgenia faecalis TaxID=2483799 RepID=UPI000FDB8304|nr:DUF2993 domain-containing protein [Georgenia faecalis]
MRRLAVVLLVLAVVLVAGGAVADRVVHARVEEELAAQVRERVDVEGGPDVVVDGFPFLTQVLAGTLAEVRIAGDRVVVDGVTLDDVQVTARDVTTAEPYAAGSVELNATLPVESLRSAVASADPGLSLAVDDGELTLGLDVLGLDVAVGVVPVAAGTAVTLELTGVSLGGAEVSADDLPAAVTDLLGEWRLEVPGLPQGLELTRVDVIEDGLRVRAAGRDVDLAGLGAG